MRFAHTVLAALAAAVPLAAGSTYPASRGAGKALGPRAAVPSTSAAGVDRAAVEAEDVEREARGMAPRFAIASATDVGLKDGTWETAGDGTQVWRYRVEVESKGDCISLNFGFGDYDMPAGGELWLTDFKEKPLVGPFTEANNSPAGELWTPIVATCDVTIEVNLPAEAGRQDLQLSLTSINVGYRGFGSGVGAKSGGCNVDVVCSASDSPDYAEIDQWRNEIPSVAVVSTGGGLFCTGSMINNAANDRTPYFLTANHCGIGASQAPSLVTYWAYETSSCGGALDGALNYFLTGATHLVSHPNSDMTLVRLNEAVPDAWVEGGIVSFAGWDRSEGDATSATAIHHPSCDEKRISFEDQPTTTSGYGGGPGSGTTHVRVGDWDMGTTEPGSSGSPLFNQDHRIIGQLHGGGAACGNNQADWYGKFSTSWSYGVLAEYLDPASTGAMFVDTLATAGPPPPPTVSPAPTIAPTPCTGVNVKVDVLTDEYPDETSWTLVDKCADGLPVVFQRDYYSSAGTQYSDEKCVTPSEFIFTILDAYGDGLCCNYGTGNYEVTYDGEVEAAGREFDGSEETTFGSFSCDATPPPTTAATLPPAAPTTTQLPSVSPLHAPSTSPTTTGLPSTSLPVCVPVIIDLTTDNWSSETTWFLTDSNDSIISTNPQLRMNEQTTTSICLPVEDECYKFEIIDLYGDGICCNYGEGEVTVTFDGTVILAAGAFGSRESVDFCVGRVPVMIDLTTDEYASETAWFLTDSSGTVISQNPVLEMNDQTTTTIHLPVEDECYKFEILDSFGDGMCCSHGEGEVTVTFDGTVVLTAGAFGSSESVDFCVGAPSSCIDSTLNIAGTGGEGCAFIANNQENCDLNTRSSHCPLSCDSCNEFGCVDSTASFAYGSGTYTCVVLASLRDSQIKNYCKSVAAYSTCRGTCNTCNL